MKTKLFISCFIFVSIFSIGQTNVIQVRKVTYDTSFYTLKTIDTASIDSGNRGAISPLFSQTRLGYWHDNVFFGNDSLYVFTEGISKRQRKQSVRNPEKFWRKIEQKKRKNKCSVYGVGYKFLETFISYQINTITTTHYQIKNNVTKQIIKNDNLIVFSDTASTDLIYRSYWFVSDFDSILVASAGKGFELCGGSRDSRCMFRTLTLGLKNYYKENRAYGFYRYSGKINDKRCQIYLNLESHLIRKAVIIENFETRHYCDLEVIKDSIFIYNAPFGEIHTGRVARKKNKIRFRNSNKNYNFYQNKKRGNAYTNRYGKSTYSYYRYPIAI